MARVPVTRRLPVRERRKRDAGVAIEANQTYPLEITGTGEQRARGGVARRRSATGPSVKQTLRDNQR